MNVINVNHTIRGMLAALFFLSARHALVFGAAPENQVAFVEEHPVVAHEEGLPSSPQDTSSPMATRRVERNIRLRGRLDTDAIGATQSPANLATYGDLEDVVGLRRARIGLAGDLQDDTPFLGEIDLAGGIVVVRDLWIGRGDIAHGGEFRFGHFREPFSMEGGQSANTFAFLERSLINTLDPARNWGFGYFRCNEEQDLTFAGGIFHAGTDASDFQGGVGADTAATIRMTVLPWQSDHELWHLGLASSTRLPDRNLVLLNQGPASPLLDFGDSTASPFVPTIRIPAQVQQLLNAQVAYQRDALTISSEWYGTWIDQIGGETIFFHGCYVDASYVLTGETRRYLSEQGIFDGIHVERPVISHFSNASSPQPRGWGAWEVTARYAYADFFSDATPRGPQGELVGVRLGQTTVGLNWYLADRLRLMFNYTHAVPDEPNTGTSSANLFSTRLAMYW